MNKIAYVFFNGDLNGNPEYFQNFIKKFPGDFFCADGGFRHCKALDLLPLEIWGDLDSITLSDLALITDSAITIKKFKEDKDFTDGELILEYLSTANYEKIYIIGGLGGRTAHTLTNLSLIVKYRNCIFLAEHEEIFFVEKSHYILKEKDTTISFIPYSSEVTNLTLTGFRFPLTSFTLYLGSSRCMSNVITEDLASIQYDGGYLIGIKEQIKHIKN